MNSVYTLVLNDGFADAVIGEFANAAFNDAYSLTYKTVFFSGQPFLVSYTSDSGVFDVGAGSGNDIAVQAVPEPGVGLLLIGGIAVALGRRRRQNS